MSCKDCEDTPSETVIRWRNANITLIGCQKHVSEVMAAINHSIRIREAAYGPDQIWYVNSEDMPKNQ